MRRLHLASTPLCVLLFLLSTAAASADEWLASGTSITTAHVAGIGMILELTDLKVPLLGETTVKCEFLLGGTIGPGAKDEVVEFLNALGEKKAVICKGIKGACGTTAEAAEMEPENLPWKTEIVLDGSTFLDKLFGSGAGKEPAYKVKCKSSGLEDLCEGRTSSVLTNNAEFSDVHAAFNLLEQEEAKELSTCSQGGSESGHLEGTGLIRLCEEGETELPVAVS